MRKQTKFSRAIATALALSLCLGSVSVKAAEPDETVAQTAEVAADEVLEDVATVTDGTEQTEEPGDILDAEITEEADVVVTDVNDATATDALEEDVTENKIAAMPSTLTISGVETISTMPANRIATVFGGSSANPPSTVYKYTPSQKGMIVYYSTSSRDTYGAIFDETGKRLATDDDSGENSNFKLQYTLEAGKTYYFALSLYSSSSSKVNINVSFEYTTLVDGWNQVDGDWYYIQNGTAVKSKALKIGNNYYCFDSKGIAYRNYVGYITMPELGYGRYGFGDSCKMLTNSWLKYKNEWYYFGADGKGVDGPQTLKGIEYNFSDGRLLPNSQIQYNGYAYYYDEDGKLAGKSKLVDGWVKLGSGWGFCKNGQLVSDGWIYDKGWYYISNYRILKDTQANIKDSETGKTNTYAFDEKGLLRKGWILEGNSWKYAGSDGAIIKSEIKEINGNTYGFDYNGYLYTCETIVKNGVYYHFCADGKMDERTEFKDGWNKFRGDWFYMNEGTLYKSQFLEYKGEVYYFGADGKMLVNTNQVTPRGVCSFDEQGHLITGWNQDTSGYWYYMDSEGLRVSGLQTIGGKTYYFGSDYRMIVDKVVYEDDVLRYFGKNGYEEDKLTPKEGWNKFQGKWYYSKSGSLVRGAMVTAEDGYTYYFESSNYEMATDRYVYVSGSYRYFDEQGHMATGWAKNSYGTYFYFDENGKAYSGMHEINGRLYSFTNGIMNISKRYYDYSNSQLVVIDEFGNVKTYKTTANGWVSFMYYLVDGKLVDGWKQIDGYWYYFVDGTKTYGDFRTIDGKTYLFDSFGRMKTGWFKNAQLSNNYDQNWGYADKNGVVVVEGWKKLDGKWYYFSNCLTCTGIQRIENKNYLFDNDGAYVKEITEKNKWVKNGKSYYYIGNDGLAYCNGIKTIDGDEYAFNQYGIMETDGWYNGRYVGPDGKCKHDCWLKFDGEWLYLDEEGSPYISSWLCDDGKWYYFDDRGFMVTGSHIIDGTVYNFDKDGVWDKKIGTLNGWRYSDGSYSYYKDGKPVNGLYTINGAKYYFVNDKMSYCDIIVFGADHLVFGKDGKLAKNEWVKCWGNYYVYADAYGRAVDGYQTIGGKNYYFDDFAMSTTDRISYDLKTLYQIDAKGVVTKVIPAKGTGWVKTANGNYAYSLNGKYLNGYHIIAKKAYFFEHGILVTNTYVEDYGYFGSDGSLEAAQGWAESKEGWIYLINGESFVGAATIKGKDYFFRHETDFRYGDAAHSVKGLVNEQGQFYYYNVDDGTRKKVYFKEGWNSYNGNWVYIKNGKYLEGVNIIDGECYWFLNGILQTNQVYSIYYGSVQAYFGKDGKLVKSQWIKYDGTYYYMDKTGLVATGIRTIDGVKYVFSPRGEYIGKL